MEKKKLYLAGPEVFLPNVFEVREEKLQICSDYGFNGIFPIDNNPLPNLSGVDLGYYICRLNKEKIKMSDAVIANITPFRSVSIDPGTAFEIGYADGLGRPVFAYTNIPELFLSRNINAFNSKKVNDVYVDKDGLIIEDFNLVDNLMIDGAIYDSTRTLLISNVVRELSDSTLFREAVIKAKDFFDRKN